MIILYINDEHCSCVEQLKEFFNNGVEYGSPLFMDLGKRPKTDLVI